MSPQGLFLYIFIIGTAAVSDIGHVPVPKQMKGRGA